MVIRFGDRCHCLSDAVSFIMNGKMSITAILIGFFMIKIRTVISVVFFYTFAMVLKFILERSFFSLTFFRGDIIL
jgi:hypothetical protein